MPPTFLRFEYGRRKRRKKKKKKKKKKGDADSWAAA
jgi:hypothetical protein